MATASQLTDSFTNLAVARVANYRPFIDDDGVDDAAVLKAAPSAFSNQKELPRAHKKPQSAPDLSSSFKFPWEMSDDEGEEEEEEKEEEREEHDDVDEEDDDREDEDYVNDGDKKESEDENSEEEAGEKKESDEEYDDSMFRNLQFRTSGPQDAVQRRVPLEDAPTAAAPEKGKRKKTFSLRRSKKGPPGGEVTVGGSEKCLGVAGLSVPVTLNIPQQVEFNWYPPKNTIYKAKKKRLCRINCLVDGNYIDCKGVRWLLPVDNTPASMKAFEYVMQHSKPEDHIIVVNVRPFSKGPLAPPNTLNVTYWRWLRAVRICRKYHLRLKDSGKSYTVFVPVHPDARKTIVRLGRELAVHKVVVGKHSREDRLKRTKSRHCRSFSSYVRKHLRTCETVVL